MFPISAFFALERPAREIMDKFVCMYVYVHICLVLRCLVPLLGDLHHSVKEFLLQMLMSIWDDQRNQTNYCSELQSFIFCVHHSCFVFTCILKQHTSPSMAGESSSSGISPRNVDATERKASSGHAENQSMVQQLTKEGN